MITFILLFIAGIMKAVKDRLDNPFTPHIFPTEGWFWNKGTGKKMLGWYPDAWHIADLIRILCFCFAVATFKIVHTNYTPVSLWEKVQYIIITATVCFCTTQTAFNIFYFIFKKHKS